MKRTFYLIHPFLPSGCEKAFTSWFNYCMKTDYTYAELFDLYNMVCGLGAGYICGAPEQEDSMVITREISLLGLQPVMCGLNDPIAGGPQPEQDPCGGLPDIAFSAALEKWELYLDSLRDVFDQAYMQKCLAAKDLESFNVTYQTSEYHYTLYYYDQAGNLVRTAPPAGVAAKHGNAAFLDDVKAKRLAVKNGAPESANHVVPDHKMTTEYRYNTLNQVVAQSTPDAGLSTFWYDRLGRLAISQNAKQVAENKYSYTEYDELGRITQVGQKPQATAMTQTISQSIPDLDSWLNTTQTKEQVTRTVYDVSYYGGEDPPLLDPVLKQENLRNRVSYTSVFDLEPPGTDPGKWAGLHNSATYYSYDFHGNVHTLLQDFGNSAEHPNAMNTTGNRYKKMMYDYDLVSGKVNMVSYQPNEPDQFYHKYLYDAENRITDVYTSHDNILWERDARYSYYRHGPLARTILGQQQVQGIDYAYTLQGWLKGVNSSAVGDGTHDIGRDGVPTGSVANQVARDAYGFNLNYFGSDYTPVSSSVTPFAPVAAPTPNTLPGQGLYNGNISSMAVNMPTLGSDAFLYRYRYDQLNRIKAMQAYTGLSNTTNTWSATATNDYKENITYDPNGNILTYLRNGATAASGLAMDNLEYHYDYYDGTTRGTYIPGQTTPVNAKITNRLNHVVDAAGGTYTQDIKTQSANNFDYDKIGNLIKDTKENIGSIIWNVYGKITQINKTTGSPIEYSYDASGNRISKSSGIKNTFYVRDASGNVMAVYGTDPAIHNGDLTQQEAHLYGSSRLGIFGLNRNVQNIIASDPGNIYTFQRGDKAYELTNHLGNVLMTVSDKKLQHSTNGTTVDYYNADIITANDYAPFGSLLPGRNYNAPGAKDARYGFNGKENDNDVKGKGNQQDYGFRIYDPRLGKFLSVDPITKRYPELTPYQFASNRPMDGIDLDGKEYLRFQSSMYTFLISQPTSEVVLETVYSNIPEQLRNAETEELKFSGYKPLNRDGTEHDPERQGPILYDASKYNRRSAPFNGAAHNPDPDPSDVIKGNAIPNSSQRLTPSNITAPVDVIQTSYGMLLNGWNYILPWSDQAGLIEEAAKRGGWSRAVARVDGKISNGVLSTNNGGVFVTPELRAGMINFVVDGTVDLTNPALSLEAAWYGVQLIGASNVQKETMEVIDLLLKAYKDQGGGNDYDNIKEFYQDDDE